MTTHLLSRRAVLAATALAALLAWPHPGSAQAPATPPPPAPATPAPAAQPATANAPVAQAAANDLDAFMARVLERREEGWRKLHDYVLSERERFEILGPGRVRLHGLDREFTWYVRDGFFVRSPVRANGVAVPERDRRHYEDRWFDREKARAAKAAARASQRAKDPADKVPDANTEPPGDPDPDVDADLPSDPEGLVSQGGEPRFISEAYFLQFTFEPGNYYLAGRETLEGRQVLRIEYYPTRLFADDEDRQHDREITIPSGAPPAQKPAPGAKQAPPGSSKAPSSTQQAPPAQKPDAHRDKPRSQEERDRDAAREQELERKLHKVTLITLWVDPAEHQIVKYTFDNVGFGFLPGRWLVRLDDVRASMTMGRYFDGVWLPKAMTMEAGLSLALGPFAIEYARTFSDYRQAETKAFIRGYTPKQEE